MRLLLIILVVLFLFGGIGVAPVWHHSVGWGYGPSGGFGLIIVILLAYLLLSRDV